MSQQTSFQGGSGPKIVVINNRNLLSWIETKTETPVNKQVATHRDLRTGKYFKVAPEEQKDFWMMYCDAVIAGINPCLAEVVNGPEQLAFDLKFSCERIELARFGLTLESDVLDRINGWASLVMRYSQRIVKDNFEIPAEGTLIIAYLTRNLTWSNDRIEYNGRIVFPYARIDRKEIMKLTRMVRGELNREQDKFIPDNFVSPTSSEVILYGSSIREDVPPLRLVAIYGRMDVDVPQVIQPHQNIPNHTLFTTGSVAPDEIMEGYKKNLDYWNPLFFSNGHHETPLESIEEAPEKEEGDIFSLLGIEFSEERKMAIKAMIDNAINLPIDKQFAEAFLDLYGEGVKVIDSKGPVYLYNPNKKLWKALTIGEFAVRMADILSRIFTILQRDVTEEIVKCKDAEMKTRLQNRLTLLGQVLAKLSKFGFVNAVANWFCNREADKDHGKLFDNFPGLLPVKGGFVIDLRTGELHPRKLEHYFTIEVPIEYHPEKGFERVEKIIATMMLEDKIPDGQPKPLTECLQRLTGYSFTGCTKEKILAILIGDGNNGKSLYTAGLTELAPMIVRQADKSVLIKQKNSSGPTPELHMLRSCRLALVPETAEGDAINEDLMKRITGRDLIPSRDLWQGILEWRAKFVPFLITNPEPVCSGDRATLNRIFMFRFKAFFCPDPKAPHERKENKDLFDIWSDPEYLQELLAWIVAGAVEYYKQGLNPPESVKADMKEYRRTQSPMQVLFEDDIEITHDDNDRVKFKDLMERYTYRCGAVGKRPVEKQLGAELTKRLTRPDDAPGACKGTSNGVYYRRLKLRPLDLGADDSDSSSARPQVYEQQPSPSYRPQVHQSPIHQQAPSLLQRILQPDQQVYYPGQILKTEEERQKVLEAERLRDLKEMDDKRADTGSMHHIVHSMASGWPYDKGQN